ncbi:MAG: hypothetical protein AVDCRST_MAG28-1244 [uncultured Rubrobacteraceae bacterium]|uniref:Sulfotransferase domain-containing protein n=1 Tax=uncultured Rubrobacteraceae bacterium TaxID=349277 RepID=A0A6J4QXM4_9ACTN|nr:MAG: hypothetical protein AVDCRST_MAG28-1244 [uncultured Rubrobacteraceae bacterium]
MPVFRSSTMFELAQDVKAFLKLEGGITRGTPLGPEQQMEEQRRMIESKDQEIARLRVKLLANGAGTQREGGINPENIVWIFGTARVGSTWLAAMMSDLERYAMWREPRVGALFGHYYYQRPRDEDSKDKHFILGLNKEVWLGSIRSFVLDAANATFSDEERDGYLVVKEPNGSIGAPLLMEALPESRMIFVVRDPRDVVASGLDAAKEGNWAAKVMNNAALADREPDAFVEERATHYLKFAGNARQAYEAHKGHKVLVKYEDLKAYTLGVMEHIYSTLRLPFDQEELARVVERRSWENLPEDKKGEGKFYRKASPGGWREDLTEQQVEIVERITAPLLNEFYPARGG